MTLSVHLVFLVYLVYLVFFGSSNEINKTGLTDHLRISLCAPTNQIDQTDETDQIDPLVSPLHQFAIHFHFHL